MSDQLHRLSTALSNRYRVERELGAGGMAMVYLAHDERHDRHVALKVLRPELAAVIGAERFLQEIKVTANLQHPHILPLHDSGDADGFLFYVMPYVEGETLRDTLDREKQLGIDEAVELTRAVASALDYAHRHGVVHRDIKPGNILLHDGQPQVADFGIALAVSQAGGARLTETGLSVGTPHYMSPEQAMGDRELDARSDIYSLGAMLYEMLAGDPPYTGSTAQAIVAKVITEKAAPLQAVRDTVPAHVAEAVALALNKLPADRFATAQSFADALTNPAWAPPSATLAVEQPAVAAQARRFPAWTVAAAAVAALALGVLIGVQLRHQPVPGVVRFYQPLEPGADDGLAVAPDGSAIVYAKRRPGDDTLFVRRADALASEVLVTAITLGGPFFSPDGERVAYFGASGQLFWVGIHGTPPVLVTDSAMPVGGSWGDDGYIYFTLANAAIGQTLARVPEGGGPIERLLAGDSVRTVTWPAVLPGSRGVAVTRGGARATSSVIAGFDDYPITVLDLDTGEDHEITRGIRARFAPPGYLLYQTASGVLFAAPFDLDRMEITGTPTPVADSVADFDVSANGTLVYQVTTDQDLAGGAGLATVTRRGAQQSMPVPRALYRNISLSPDGRRLALEIQEDPTQDGGYIALLDLGDSVLGRLTFEGLDTYPAWTPDGSRIVFSRSAGGERDVYWKRVDGRGPVERLFERPGEQFEPTVSPDGAWLLYRDGNADVAGSDLGIRRRSLRGDIDSAAVDQPEALERSPALSPDGRWLAYLSDDVGESEVFVRPYPGVGSGARWQISFEGGSEPVWAHNGRELFYKSGGYMMAAELQTAPNFAVRARRQLFSIETFFNNSWHPRYVVLPGDQGFAMITLQEGAGTTTTVVVLNWVEELERE